jgi:hypothetical protein
MKRVVARHTPLYLTFFFSDEGADDAATCDARHYINHQLLQKSSST